MSLRAWVGAVVAGSACSLALVSAQDWRSLQLASFDVVWETVRDSHHDPRFGGVDWAGVRAELRPRVEHASSPSQARGVVREMLARLGRSHFVLIAADEDVGAVRGPATVGADVRVSQGQTIVTRVRPGTSAAIAGLGGGDVILAIDDVDLEARADVGGLVGLDDLAAWRRVTAALSGDVGVPAVIRVQRPDGAHGVVAVPREIEDGDPIAFGNLPPVRARLDAEEVRGPSGERVAVIAFNVWMPALSEPFARAIDRFRDADGLVIDLSGNPGGLIDMMRGVAGHLFDEPALLGRMHTRSATLEFRANPRRVTTAGRRVVPYAGPVAIVVDGLTASASECFAAALQSLGRARVFGVRTMGQALPALTRSLPSGDVLMYAVGDFSTSTGLQIEGRGVEPDEEVRAEPDQLAAGRDARWQAVRWSAQQRAGRR